MLTRRTEDLPTHKGHVAFPGGGVHADDASIEAAALREAFEEVGLPAAACDVLGLLDDMPTVNFSMAVTPVVAWVRALPPLCVDPREVARVFELPLEAMRDPAKWTVKHMDSAGRGWPVYYFPWDGEVLWGLSAYVALALMELSPLGAPFQLPHIDGSKLQRALSDSADD